MGSYSIFLIAIVTLTVFGISKLATAEVGLGYPRNVTVIYQSASLDTKHLIVLERCAKEDCSDTPE